MGRRVLITGLDTFWGGRMAQALENEAEVEMILGLGANEPRVPAGKDRIRPIRPEVLDPQPHRTSHPGGHHRAHLPRDQLRQRGGPRSSRDQRHRHPQPPGRRWLLGFVGPSGGHQVFHPRLRCCRNRSRLVPRDGQPHVPCTNPSRAFDRRGGGTGPGLRRGQPTSGCVGAPLRQRAGHGHHHADQLRPTAPDSSLHRRLRPPGPVRGGGRRGARPRTRDPPPHPRLVQRGRCRQAPLERGGLHLRWLPPSAFPFPTSSVRRPISSTRALAVPSRDGGLGPIRPRGRHGPPGRCRDSTIATPVPGPSRASPGPTTCGARPERASPCTATNRMSSSSSGTRLPWSEASTPDLRPRLGPQTGLPINPKWAWPPG